MSCFCEAAEKKAGGDAPAGHTRRTSRTRRLRRGRPRILCWRRHGKAGGCQHKKRKGHGKPWGRRVPAARASGREEPGILAAGRNSRRGAGRSRPACTLKTPYRSEMGKRNLSKKEDIKHIDIRETNKQERSRQACSYACRQAKESKKAATLCSRRGQARKGAGRMPWH